MSQFLLTGRAERRQGPGSIALRLCCGVAWSGRCTRLSWMRDGVEEVPEGLALCPGGEGGAVDEVKALGLGEFLGGLGEAAVGDQDDDVAVVYGSAGAG